MTQRQSQSAETGLQAGRDIHIHQGIDAKTAIEIFDARAVTLRAELTEEANATLEGRLQDLEARLVPAFERAGLLPAFADPDFQFNLLEAQRSAARSGDPSDFDLLVDLLVQRAEAAPEARVRLATRKALNVVGLIDPPAINALAACWFFLKLIYLPTEIRLETECEQLEADMAPLMGGGLPEGPGWVEDLDVLDCVNKGSQRDFFSFFEIMARRCPGPLCLGIAPEAVDELRKVLDAESEGLSQVIIEHENLPGGFRLLGKNADGFRAVLRASQWEISDDTLNRVIDANRFDSRITDFPRLVDATVSGRPNLERFAAWWPSVPYFDFTLVGTAVACAFARKQVSRPIPTLEECLQA